MAEEYEEDMNGEDSGTTGPGAPTPVSALEVSKLSSCLHRSIYDYIIFTKSHSSRDLRASQSVTANS